jgi:hypothetical protein
MTAAFTTQQVLIKIEAIFEGNDPSVTEIRGMVDNWETLRAFDVVVGIPQSISPTRYPGNLPPTDLFDLIVVDEAHHAPAPTWRAILEHFNHARALLLTATPRRRDGRKLPGEHVYHYPLRQALAERIFQPVRPILLEPPSPPSRSANDELIAARVAELKARPEHANSTVMVRASTKDRAGELANLYNAHGLDFGVVHSTMKRAVSDGIVDGLRRGSIPGVVVVGMLVEGFDLPSLRILAYHDKHKSLPATAQIIGRLARVDDDHVQDSIMVTVRDIDVYPDLQGVVRELYEEDADWATVLPGIIDDEIAAQNANRDYVAAFRSPVRGEVAAENLAPLRRCICYEIAPGSALAAAGFFTEVPDEYRAGQVVRGETIIYSGLNPEASSLVLVTQAIRRPRWHLGDGLDSVEYSLHILSWRTSPRTNVPDLLLANSDNVLIMKEMLTRLDPDLERTLGSPRRMQESFDSLKRVSVSSVGLRNSYGGQVGQASYKMVAGKGVDRGMREADTSFGTLGHAMAQIDGELGAVTAGVATGKGKYWETAYSHLLEYDAFLTSLAERYWFPPAAPGGPLLPQINRGARLEELPSAHPIAAEVDGGLMGTGWADAEGRPLDCLDLVADAAERDATGLRSRLALRLVDPSSDSVLWTGWQDLQGDIVTDTSGCGVDYWLARGYGGRVGADEILSVRPPTIFFADGSTVIGATIVESRTVSYELPSTRIESADWSGTDLKAETKETARKHNLGTSIHETLENYLSARARRGRYRWIVHNDGRGEFADYLVIEASSERIYLDFWHAKAADGSAPSVRVSDFQEVTAQAIKSRRWITDPSFWLALGRRLDGSESPIATVIEGRPEQLKILCGLGDRDISFAARRPVVVGRVVIVQPGLSLEKLISELFRRVTAAKQVRDLLAVFHDSVSQVGDTVVLCSR